MFLSAIFTACSTNTVRIFSKVFLSRKSLMKFNIRKSGEDRHLAFGWVYISEDTPGHMTRRFVMLKRTWFLCKLPAWNLCEKRYYSQHDWTGTFVTGSAGFVWSVPQRAFGWRLKSFCEYVTVAFPLWNCLLFLNMWLLLSPFEAVFSFWICWICDCCFLPFFEPPPVDLNRWRHICYYSGGWFLKVLCSWNKVLCFWNAERAWK